MPIGALRSLLFGPVVTNDSYVELPVDSTGKLVQMFENSIAGNIVQAMAITIVDPTSLTNSFVQVADNLGGKKMQYFENTISGEDVHCQAVCLVDTSGSSTYG